MKFRLVLSQFFVYFFIVFSIAHNLFGSKENLLFLRLAQGCGVLSFFWVIWNFKSFRWKNSFSFRLLLVLSMSIVLVNLINGQLDLFSIVYPLSFFSISFLIRESNVSLTFFLVLTILVYSWLGYEAVNGISPNDWVKGSRNHVSVLVIYLVILTQLIVLFKYGGGSLITHAILPFGALIFSVLAIGRGGIISCGLLLIFSVNHLIFKNRKVNLNVLILLIGIFFVGIWFFNILDVLNQFDIFNQYLYKFENQGFKSEDREYLIYSYINSLSTLDFFIGNWDFSLLDLTLHNSYLHWHMKYGLGSLFFCLIILRKMWHLISLNFSIFLILLVVLFRSWSDQILVSDGILFGLPFFTALNWQDKISLKSSHRHLSNNSFT